MSDPLVSVVIPAYDRPERTRRAVSSVANQTYDPVELVVIDDGSTPPLAESVSLPAGRFADTTLVTHETNRGANSARNTGIDLATGTSVAFLDSDDEWEPAKLARQVDQLEGADDRQVSYTGVRQLDAKGNLNGIQRATAEGDLRERLLRGNVVGTFSSVVVDREAVESVGRPDPEMLCWQDWEWFLRLSETVSFGAIPDPLTVRHNEGGQVSSAFEQKRDVAAPMIEARIRELAPTERVARVGLAYLDFQLGQAALSNGRYADARAHFVSAIKTHPSEGRFYAFLACSGVHYRFLRRCKRTLVRMRSRGE